jgi:hypothetical protein
VSYPAPGQGPSGTLNDLPGQSLDFEALQQAAQRFTVNRHYRALWIDRFR